MDHRVVAAGRTFVSIFACLAVASASVRCGSESNGGSAETDAGPDAQVDASAPGPDAEADVITARGDNPISTENAQPGTTEWMLTSPATQREIEGYASSTSVAPGGAIDLFVNTAAVAYTIEIYRLGWYAGKGGRLMVPAIERPGRVQVDPTPDTDGLVECDWADPYALTIPNDWTSGVYVARLTTKGTGKQSYIPFVVRDDVRLSTYLAQSSVTTFQAYNNWGGKSLYDFNSTGGVRASRVSFLRPYALGLNPESAAGVGAGELITNLQGTAQTGPMGWELPMVRFLEREGLDVSYVTNVDVHRDADLVGKHKVFLSMGHDEYWSSAMRDHVEYARDHGSTSLAFFSGNVSYWQIRLLSSKGNAPNATILCTKNAATDPVALGGDAYATTVLFRDPLVGRGEEGLGGVAFQDYGVNADLVVDEPSSWVFTGTNLTAGAKLPGLLGYEVDGLTEPPIPGARRITRSGWTSPQGTGYSEAAVRALPSGAETFAIGSIQAAWGLDSHRPPGVTQPNVESPLMQQVARNVLARLAAPRPARARSAALLDEAFGGELDRDRWALRTISEGAAAFDPAVGVAVTGGRLTVTTLANANGLHHGGLATARTLPMMCGSVRVELVQAAAGASSDTTLSIAVDAGRFYRATVEGTALVFGANNGAMTQTAIAYDPAQHRHLRIRHDCPTDSVVFETSPDKTTWTVRRTVPRDVDLRAAHVELEAGTFQSTASSQAIFDDVHVEATGVMDRFDGQRDPELFTPDAVHEGGYDPEVLVFPQGGALHLRPRGGLAGVHHMGLYTTREIDWTGGVAGITVLKQPNPATEASVSLAILPQVAGWARLTVSAGRLFFQAELAKTRSSTSVVFDPTAHKHLRMRHLSTTNEIVWETSPDRVTWVEQRRLASPFPVNIMRAEIEAGTYQPEVDPQEALVDDFVFAR